MPTICAFFGIVIRMYYDEHAPPHFHAMYNNDEVIIEIETLKICSGHVPRRALALILEWAAAHRRELTRNWKLAREHKPLRAIKPLE